MRLERPTASPPDEPHFTPYLWEDEVTYDDEAFWPAAAGNGSSLHRRSANAWGNSPFAWRDSEPTPGRVDFADDPYEPNNAHSEAYALDVDRLGTRLVAVAGQGVQGDEDWYRIDVPPGHQHLVAEVEFRHADGNIDLAVSDDAAARFAVAQSMTDNERIDVVLPSDGIWYLQVHGEDAANVYDLRWNAQYVHPADANLDGSTDVRDFNDWNAHKFTAGTTWRQGDFNGDGKTDVRDFNVWNEHKFTSATLPAPVCDAVLEQGAARESANWEAGPWLAWLDNLDSLRSSNRSAAQENRATISAVADRVLATYWP
jgi:hypothetical protein